MSVAENISIAYLKNGEAVALSALEITAIPHYSIIDSRNNAVAEVVENYKNDMGRMLNEVYQEYKSQSIAARHSKDISLELLWSTEAVKNQPFDAKIRLFMIVRAIDRDESAARYAVERVMNIFCATLSIQKYNYAEISYSDLSNVIKNIQDNTVCAIVKEEKTSSLQSPMMPICYDFDRLPATDTDLSRIVNVLVNYPNCAVSMQLIPATLYAEEKAEIDRCAQMLDVISHGIMQPGIGNISNPLAAEHAETYKYYSQNKDSSLFIYNILIYGSSNAACQDIATKVYGQLSSGSSSANLKYVNLNAVDIRKDSNFYPLPWAVSEMLVNSKGRNPQLWKSKTLSKAYFRLPYIITVEEGAEFFRLPIGSDLVSAGLVVNESEKEARTYSPNIINAGDITVGKLKSSDKGDTIGLSLKDLAKHMLVVGTSGTGKTTFTISVLDRLWKDYKIPFLVIEPAKNEYRALIKSIPDLQVFTPGKSFISPFVFNPFVPPKNVNIESYKSSLKTAFAAAVSMQSPLDNLFKETIKDCYSDFKWLDERGEIFNISDFIKCFQSKFNAIGYTGDANNIGKAGIVRLTDMATLFDNYYSIPIEDLLSKPTIIELSAIENSDEKALIIALLLLSILSYINANYQGNGDGLRNVILLEEAHVLLDSDSNKGQGEADPSGVAQGLLKRMLAELRSYGVGIIICDQSPRKVTADVVGLTDIKMAFRLVENADKEIIGNSMSMPTAQKDHLSKLKVGEAFMFFTKLQELEEVITPDYRLENNIDVTLSDDTIKSLSTYWNDKQDKLRPYPQCDYCQFCQNSCNHSRRVLAKDIARRIYAKNFNPESKDFKILENVLGKITKLVKAELNGIPLTPELMACIRVHLWRKIRYDTKIKVRDIQIENSVKKSGGPANNG